MPGERNSDNLKNEGITKAKILSYSDLYDFNYRYQNTIKPEEKKIYKNGKQIIKERSEVYINLYKRYKHSRPQRFDVVLPLKSSIFIPRMVYWENENDDPHLIYSNDTIWLRRETSRILPDFIFIIMNSVKVRKLLDNEAEKNTPRRISCGMIEKIMIDLPSVEQQREIIKIISKNNLDIEKLIG